MAILPCFGVKFPLVRRYIKIFILLGLIYIYIYFICVELGIILV